MRKVLYVSGTRADYGLMRSVLKAIDDHPELELEVVATGMHFMNEFGMTINEIRDDGFKIHVIKAAYEKDDKGSMAHFIGEFILLLTDRIKDIRPDLILLLGDRGEMLAGAIVGAYLTFPVAHVHGGEVTSTVDEFARHAITKLSHIHFPATHKSAERIIKMGEDEKNVFVVGAPGLDPIINADLIEPQEICRKYGLDPSDPILLVVQHPVTIEVELAAEQIHGTLESIKELGYQTILIYPNADAGGRSMIEVIKQYEYLSNLHTYKSIPHIDYLSLMSTASVLLGNSSSGIIEAPSFHLPVINIGSRQIGRETSDNVLNVDYDKDEIIKSIEISLSDDVFLERVAKCVNPYGTGDTGKKVADILSKIKINNALLQKKITY